MCALATSVRSVSADCTGSIWVASSVILVDSSAVFPLPGLSQESKDFAPQGTGQYNLPICPEFCTGALLNRQRASGGDSEGITQK